MAPKVGDAWGDGVIFAVGKVTGYDENTSSFMTDITGINAYRGREVSSKSLGSIEWCSDKAKGASSLIGVVNYNDGKSNLIALESFTRKMMINRQLSGIQSLSRFGKWMVSTGIE